MEHAGKKYLLIGIQFWSSEFNADWIIFFIFENFECIATIVQLTSSNRYAVYCKECVTNWKRKYSKSDLVIMPIKNNK